jgi:hypothetical protein
MRFRYLVLLIAVCITAALGPSAARVAEADANNPDVIPTFVNAVNSGDTATALQVVSPSLTITLANGRSIPFSASTPVPQALLPITIISLTPEGMGSQTVDAVVTFGADPTQQHLQFKGEGGVIVSITALGP